MEFLRVKARVRDPMLIVAPLTTLGHWRREIETWTTMNTICYMGGKDDRVVRPRLAVSPDCTHCVVGSTTCSAAHARSMRRRLQGNLTLQLCRLGDCGVQ